MDDYTTLDVGWVASVDGILKVMYLSPEYIEYEQYGMGWFFSSPTAPRDTFDITVRHAIAILAAGQTQLDDMEGLESASGQAQHEVSDSRVGTKRFRLLTSPDSCLLPEPARHGDSVDYVHAEPEHSIGAEGHSQSDWTAGHSPTADCSTIREPRRDQTSRSWIL